MFTFDATVLVYVTMLFVEFLVCLLCYCKSYTCPSSNLFLNYKDIQSSDYLNVLLVAHLLLMYLTELLADHGAREDLCLANLIGSLLQDDRWLDDI